METTDAFVGLHCLDCGATTDEATSYRCPECGGFLDPAYDIDAVSLSRRNLESRRFDSLWRYEELLPLDSQTAVTLGEGATPLVDCPTLADELGVGRVAIKDEGQNPTGTVDDRGISLATTVASASDECDVALASTGRGGQSAAAYAGRAGLDCHVYLPARAGFSSKAMVNVHGGDMTVVGGRFDDAYAAFEEAAEEHEGWCSLAPFETPFRHEGAKTILYEIVEQLDWTVPDAVVVPTGHGTTIVGMAKGAREVRALDLVDAVPSLYAAQSSSCAPIASAFEQDLDDHEPWNRPDTICGSIEVPDPAGGPLVLDALRDTDGGAVATDDPAVLDAAIAVASHEGIELSPSSAAAASGAWKLAEHGAFEPDDTVVIVNSVAGAPEADVLRSHLMGQGV